MRIAQVTPRYRPYIGGVEMVVEKLATGMVEQGHHVEVLTIDPEGNLPAEELIDGVRVRRFRASKIYDYSPDLGRYLRTQGNNFDVVHAHSLHTFIPQVAAQARQRGGRFRLIITGHYHGRGKTRASTFLLGLYRPIARRVLKAADGFICVSNFEADLLKNHFRVPAGKIAVVPNGVEVDEIRSASPFPEEGKCILIVSRLERYKNVELAIRAMQYIDRGIKLVIVGDGPDRPRLQQTVEATYTSKLVSFQGRVSKEDLHRWYKTCSLVMNLSDLEAFGLTVIEGLAADKPVLVNNRTGLAELASTFEGVTAVDAKMMSIQELAKSIEQRMATAIPAPEFTEYSWLSIVLQVVAQYEKTNLAHTSLQS